MKKHILSSIITMFLFVMALTFSNNEEVSAACSHTPSATVTKAATCSTKGTRTIKCTKCKITIRTESIPALGHSWDNGTVTTKPTCTATGTRTYNCKRIGCKATKPSSISPTGHSPSSSYVVTKAATCDSKGKKEKKCTKCSKVLDTVSIPALGHNWNSGTVTKKATCTTTGTKTYSCKRSGCKATKTDTIPKTSHSPSSSYIVTKAATCSTQGTQEKRCLNNCTIVLDTQPIPALGHNWDSGTITTAATCTTTGTKTYRCTRSGCQATKPETISKNQNHSISSTYTVTKVPTCTEKGTTSRLCTRCQKILESKDIEKAPHLYGTYVRTIAPTETRVGSEYAICETCKYKNTRNVAKVSAEDYEAKLLPADGGSSYGYILFNGVKYPINVYRECTGPTITASTTKIASIEQNTRKFNWATFAGNFCISEELPLAALTGMLAVPEVAAQISNSFDYNYKCIEIFESADGTTKYARILIGDSNYENTVATLGTGTDVEMSSHSFWLIADTMGEYLYEKATGEAYKNNLPLDVIVNLSPRRAGGKYYACAYMNSRGVLVTKRFAYSDDKMYIAKQGIFSSKTFLDVSYMVNPSDSRFIAPLV